MDSSISPKDETCFCAWAITFQLTSTSSLLGPHIFLSTQFSNTLWSSPYTKHRVSAGTEDFISWNIASRFECSIVNMKATVHWHEKNYFRYEGTRKDARTRRPGAPPKKMYMLQNRVQNHPVPLFFTSRSMSKWVGKSDPCEECRERETCSLKQMTFIIKILAA